MQPHGHSYFINAFDNDWLHKTSLQLKHDIGYYFVTLTLPDFLFVFGFTFSLIVIFDFLRSSF